MEFEFWHLQCQYFSLVFSEETWLVALFGHFWLKCWSLLSPSFWLWSIRQNGQEFSSTSPLDALFYSTVRNGKLHKIICRFLTYFFCDFSCIWHLPKYRVWLSSQAAFQVHWSCRSRISKYFEVAQNQGRNSNIHFISESEWYHSQYH